MLRSFFSVVFRLGLIAKYNL
jgi:dienelactone hydrolase